LVISLAGFDPNIAKQDAANPDAESTSNVVIAMAGLSQMLGAGVRNLARGG
jgi:hypothetical protein